MSKELGDAQPVVDAARELVTWGGALKPTSNNTVYLLGLIERIQACERAIDALDDARRAP